MSKLSIADIIRAAHVSRWQIVRTLRTQNILEHQYIVTMIAQEIANMVMMDNFTPERRLRLIDFALHHDLVEQATGDISTPVKQRIRAIVASNGIDPFDTMEKEICETCYQIKKDAGELLRSIVKLADIMDGIQFLNSEGHGEHSKHVLLKLKKTLDTLINKCRYEWPRYNWDGADYVYCEIMDNKCSYLKFEGVIE